MEEPKGLEFVGLARDGIVHHIRDAGPEDKPEIQRLLDALSPRSAYQRFLSASPGQARHYCEALFDPHRTLDAVLATTAGELVAIGSTHRLSADSAEFALAIADRHQGHGVGTLVLESLVERARARGVALLVGEVLVANAQMLDVLSHLGLPLSVAVDQGVAEVTIDLRENAEYQRATARRATTARGSSGAREPSQPDTEPT